MKTNIVSFILIFLVTNALSGVAVAGITTNEIGEDCLQSPVVVWVEGAGSTGANIVYKLNEEGDDGTYYSNYSCEGAPGEGFKIFKEEGQWRLLDSDDTILYTIDFDSEYPPNSGWQVENGVFPAPTLRGSVTSVEFPVASNVVISGNTAIGQTLTASYEYSHPSDTEEDGSTYKWYRSDDASGNGKTEIEGATSETYTTTAEDIGKYISFEVTPNDGSINGAVKESNLLGPVTSPFAGGTGSELDPFKVATAEQLNSVRDFLDKYFEQTADIDLSGYANWEPIGDGESEFTGTYNGGGNEITGLSINRPTESTMGLFGYNNGEIHGIGLKGSNITGDSRVGGLVGDNRGKVYESYTTGAVAGNGSYIGGLVGFHDDGGTITNTYSTANVTGGSQVGGLVGATWNSAGLISNSWSAGLINGSSTLGGIIGRNEASAGANNLFWDTNTSELDNSAFGEGIATAEMKTKSTFTDAGWDFDDTWQIVDPSTGSISYPYLQGNAQDPAPGLKGLNENADLATLILSNGTLDPIFDPETTSYTVDVDYQTSAITITPTADDDNATITVEEETVDGGSASEEIELSVGKNTITIKVTAEDGITTKTYTVEVNRESPFAAGAGTEDEPYELSSAEDLAQLGNFPDAHFKLSGDIDLDVAPYNEGEGWEPVGDSDTPFAGTFDGDGFTLSGLTINRPAEDNVGFFGVLEDAVIKNITLQDVSVTGNNNAGALAGNSTGSSIDGITISGSTSGSNNVGGMVGLNDQTHIAQSSVTGEVTGEFYTGGLAGYNQNSAEISSSFTSVELTSHGNSAGGLVGMNTGSSRITDSYAIGSVASTGDNMGGLAGENLSSANIENSYAGGPVSGNNNVGGLVGHNEATITDSFWDTDIGPDNGEGNGLNTTAMKNITTFSTAGWDLNITWQIKEPASGSLSYPYLRAPEQDPIPGLIDVELATLNTGEAANITSSSASISATITGDGNTTITERGFVWSTETGPDIDDNKVEVETADESYNAVLDNLPPATTIYVRSYSVNVFGTGYGDETSFQTQKQDLTVEGTFTAHNKTYDGETTATLNENNLSLSGIFPGESVSLNNIVLEFTDAHVDGGIEVSISSAELSGTDADNYTLSLGGAPTATANITAKELTIGGDFSALDKTYEGNTEAFIDQNNLTLVGAETGDEVSLTSLGIEFAGAEAATGITVSIGSAELSGADADNYTLSLSGSPTDEAAITQKELTLAGSFTTTAKIYDGTATATLDDSNLELDGIIEGEEVTLDGFDLNFAQADAGTDLMVSLVNPVLAGADNTNYTVTATGAPTFQADITPRTLNLFNFTADNKTYDGTTDVTGDGFDDDRLSGDELEFSYDVAFASKDAGTGVTVNYSNITISGGADQVNYTPDATTGSSTADITQRALAIAADGKTKVYGAGDPDLTYQISSDSLVAGESLTGDLERATGEGVGTYVITQGTLAAGSNYTLTYTGANLEITTKNLVVTADAGQSKVYGQAEPGLTYNATGFEHSDDATLLTGALTRAAGEDADTYLISQGSVSADANYTITYNSADFTIEPKVLTVTVDSGLEKAYGEEDPELTYQVNGFAGGDDASILAGDLEKEGGEDAGTYFISEGNLSAGSNYTIEFEEGVFTITPRTLTLSNFEAEDKIYDGTKDAQGSFEDDRFEGDELSFSYEVAFGDESAGEDKQVLFSQITISGGTSQSNYQLESGEEAAEASITPRELSISATSGSKEFGESDPSLSYQITSGSMVDGEQLSGTIEREEGEGVGTYAITQGSLTGDGNYTIDFTDAVFTIEGRGLLIQAEEGQGKIYGEADPEFAYQVSGFAPGDDDSILSGSLSRENGENVGNYEITLGNLEAGENYEISIESAAFTIDPAELVVIADPEVTKIQGETDPELTYQVSGFAFDDDESLIEGALSREDGEEYGSYTITLGTLGAGANYDIAFMGADFQILRTAPVVVDITPVDTQEQVAVDAAVYIDFDQDVTLANEAGITLTDEAGQTIDRSVESDNNRVQIIHEGFQNSITYTVTVATGAVENLDGIENDEIAWSFTTIVELPAPVVLNSPADSSGAVPYSESLNFSWQPSLVAETYEMELAPGADFVNPIYQSDAVEETSMLYEASLEPGQTYQWRVRALNQAGPGPWSAPSMFVTRFAPVALSFPEDGATGISTAPRLQWDKSAEESVSMLRVGPDELLTSTLIDLSTDSSTHLLEGLSAEQTYYWQVQDSASIEGVATLSGWSDIYAFATRPDPEQTEDEPVVVTIDFGGTSGSGNEEPGGNPSQTEPQQTDYRMVGLPGTDGIPLNEFFEGPYREAWRAFFENGAPNDFYDEFTADDARFTFTPGQGFWVLSTDIVTGERRFEPVATNDSDAYGFGVHPGWNIIANPYQSSVEWSLVEAFNGIESPLYGYQQSFVPVDTLKPFEGYYYYNDPSWEQDRLFIPYTGYEQRGTAKVASKTSELLKGVPQIKLSMGTEDKALNKVDLILARPMKESGEATMERLHPNLGLAMSGMVITDDEDSRLRYNRKLVYDAEVTPYHLEAKTTVGHTFEWSMERLNQPEAEAVLLVNKATNVSFMITTDKPAKVKATEPVSRFELYIGAEQELMERQASLLPTAFSLSQNYPNPFNPSTNIRFSVPEHAQVTLEIYDILGRRVQSLVNEAMQPGWHVVSWNASQFSSGVYLYRLQSGSTVFTKKLTLIK